MSQGEVVTCGCLTDGTLTHECRMAIRRPLDPCKISRMLHNNCTRTEAETTTTATASRLCTVATDLAPVSLGSLGVCRLVPATCPDESPG